MVIKAHPRLLPLNRLTLKSNDSLSLLHLGRLSYRPQVKSPRQRASTHEEVNQ